MYTSSYQTISGALAQIQAKGLDKLDYLVPLSKIFPVVEGDTPGQIGFRGLPAEATGTFHGQLAECLGVPIRYYHKMRLDAPQLWAENVRTWLDRKGDEERLIRTYRGDTLRALLSPSYARIDHDEAIGRLGRALQGPHDLELKGYDLTSDRLSLKLISPKIGGEVAKGDVVRVGLEIANSETGCGVVQIRPLIYRLVCTNGMVAGSAFGELRRRHKGAKLSAENSHGLLPSAAGQVAEEFWGGVAGRVERILSHDGLTEIMRPLTAAAGVYISQPDLALRRVVATYTLDEVEAESAAEHWALTTDKTVWGLSNAVTAVANTAHTYERATALESAGWDICQSPGKWAAA